LRDKIKAIEEEALREIASSGGPGPELEAIRIKYLGRKGLVTELFKKMGEVSAEDKAETGRLINALKDAVTRALEEKSASGAGSAGDSAEKIDITLPGIPLRPGRVHPVTRTLQEICDLFISLGFRVVEGPEIESEHYNFETLNIPLEHPSRDAFDTFYLRLGDLMTQRPNDSATPQLLRSHTSPVQARFMEKNKPPFSIVVPGRVFRPDATDASHSFMFHQVEGLVVGRSVRFSDLKGTLGIFAKQMFGSSARMRFRPSFFPFTEPSAEVDVSCILCGENNKQTQRPYDPLGPASETRDGRAFQGKARAKHCSMCGGKGWLEIMGAGMVNPRVFEKVGYDPEKVTGFAFGMGVERIAILKYGITDIRMFFENDVRFLKQF
jgi:phenylalanyl-tRNA synthetase alpha chain